MESSEPLHGPNLIHPANPCSSSIPNLDGNPNLDPQSSCSVDVASSLNPSNRDLASDLTRDFGFGDYQRHPCNKLGECPYGEKCKYRDYPLSACVFFLRGRCSIGTPSPAYAC